MNKDTMMGLVEFLTKLSAKQKEVIKLNEFVMKHRPPYTNSITNALLNIGIVEWVSKGTYRVSNFFPTPELATRIQDFCSVKSAERTRKSYAKLRNGAKATNITTDDLVVTPTNHPFGFNSFDTIMVEKGTIVIGEYTLTGSFTIERTTSINPVKKE